MKNLQKKKALTKSFCFSLLVAVLVIIFPTNIIIFINPAYAMDKPDNPGGRGQDRVNYFCKENKEACGMDKKQRIIRTDEEKRLIAIELIEAINRYRENNKER